MWHRRIDWIEPIEAALRCRDRTRLAFLDSARREGARPDPRLGRYSYLGFDPFAVFAVRDGVAFWNGVAESAPPVEALRRRFAAHRTASVPDLPPFQGGAMGAVAYEFGWLCEGLLAPHPGRFADVDLGFYDGIVAWDHAERACWLFAAGVGAATSDECFSVAQARLDALEDALRAHARPPEALPAIDWRAAWSREAHCEKVERVRELIRAGDIYQANIAQRFTALCPVPPLDAYAALRAANPAPFAAYLDLGERQLLSTSPELFLRLSGRTVETRPIKGTVRRRADPVEDLAAAAALAASRKDRAENVMIVDLLRNDLSRVCETHSVEVTALCDVESYAGLHHLVSAVSGTLREGVDALDLLVATFPGGSITGAPKLRAMEIIAAIEEEARGVYCGSIGTFGFDGSAHLSIAIRTVVAKDGMLELRSGGGITLLSEPEAEYEETLTKARRIFEAGHAGVEAALA